MISNSRLWTCVIAVTMLALLYMNFSNKLSLVKLSDFKPKVPTGAEITCKSFTTQSEAQRFFENNGGPTIDKFGLDRDHDGRVCESNL